MVLPTLPYVKGGTNTMRPLVTLEKYKRNIDDVSVMGSYAWNILQWNKNKTKMTQWRLLTSYKGIFPQPQHFKNWTVN